MKTLLIILSLLAASPLLKAQDAELQSYQDELARAKKLKNSDSIAAAYCHLGEYYAYRQSDSTRYYCELGLKYADKEVQEPYIILLNNLAETYNAEGNMEEAIRALKFTFAEAKRLKYEDAAIASILASTGVSFRRLNQTDSALVYYNKALDFLEGKEAYDEEVHVLTSIGVLYANTGRLKESENYLRHAVEVSRKCDDMDMVIYAATAAGGVFALQNRFEEATRMLYPALVKAREQRKPKFILKAMTFLLNTYVRMGERDSIDHYIKEADKIAMELPESSVEMWGYRETQFEVLTRMGRYQESLDIQYKLLRMTNTNFQSPLDKLYLRMARNYVGLKDYTHATEFYEKAFDTADSLHRTEVDAELTQLSMKYENQKKELEIARLTQEQLEQKAKTMQWGIAAAIAICAFLSLAFYYLFRQKRMKKEEELKLARSYIGGLERERTRFAKELHDGVCNDLLGIGLQMQTMQPTEESKREVLDLLEQVRTDVRCISHELMPPKFLQTTLAEAVEEYVTRLALPASMQLAFSKENEGMEWRDVPEQTAYEVYRILQELLSNILKHSAATQVDVNLYLKDRLLTLDITNDGKSYSDEAGKGIGLTTTRERIKAINGSFSMDIQPGRQSFKLEIPLFI